MNFIEPKSLNLIPAATAVVSGEGLNLTPEEGQKEMAFDFVSLREQLASVGIKAQYRTIQSDNFVSGSAGWKLGADGTITASAGSIGGWSISATALYYDGATDAVSAGMASADYPFYAGKKYIDRATAPFRVTSAGAITATNAIISCGVANAIVINYGSDILLKHGGDIKFTSVTAPGACTATLVATDVGNVDAGTHTYKVTFVNEHGETELGTASNIVTTDATHKQVDLTAIPTSPSGSVTQRKIYRTRAGGSDYYLLVIINNNTATAYTDNTADVNLTGGRANSKENDTFGKLIIEGNESLSLGWKNVFIGQLAGSAITVGYGNVGIATQTLYKNTTGYQNIAIGYMALFENTSGCRNTAIGAGGVLYKNTTGYRNSAMGYATLYFNTTGECNSAVGYTSLFYNTTGYHNSAMGAYALEYNTTGEDNSAVGYTSLSSNTTGYRNSAIGSNALYRNTTGYCNSAVGSYVLYYNTIGYRNSAVGYHALLSNTTGYCNSAMGSNALYSNKTGSDNIAIGYYAGFYETGSNAFYVNNQDRTDLAGDKAKSLMYGVMNADQTLQKLQINANLKIGAGDVRATTVGTRVFDIFDGTAPAGTLANGISLYSTAGELRVMDATGNATLLSPHDKETNEWIYDCVDKNGKRLKINMERMMKAINKKFGWDFVKEYRL